MRISRAYRSISILISSISFLFISPASAPAQDQPEEQSISLRRRVVEKVDLLGIVSFDHSDIKGLLYTKPNHWYNFLRKRELSKSNVNLDKGIIKRFYGRRGFLFTEVNSIIGRAPHNKATVTFSVYEGKRVYLAEIKLEGGLEEINRRFDKILNDFEMGRPVDAEEVASNGFRLRDLYFNNGYPYAKIYSRFRFSFDSSQVSITYAVAESTLTFYGQTAIPNDAYTRQFVIRRELLVKPGKLYSQKDVTDSEQRMYSLGLFKLVSLRREDSTAVVVNDTGRVDFSLSLRERKSYFVNFGIGLGPQPGFPLTLRSTARWGNRNILGTGRQVNFSVSPYFRISKAGGGLDAPKLSDLGKGLRLSLIKSTIELDYITPWLLIYRVPVTAKAIYEPYTLNVDPSYRYDRIAGEVVFSRELDKYSTARITANTEYINILNVPAQQEEAYKRELGDNGIRRRLLFYAERDTRGNILVPQKGAYSFAGLDYVGGILGGDFSYVKAQAMWSRFNLITGQNILATRIWLGFLDDRLKGGRSAPTDRFMVGGSTTIRGFGENDLGPKFILNNVLSPEGGRYLMIGNAEIRRPLFWRFGGTMFFDAGNTYARWEEITPISIRFSTGLGLQFFTPIGPIRLDYAVRLQKQFDLGAGLYHFAILYAF